MKKLFLATALAAVSLTSVNAKWDGFYARGSFGLNAAGATNKLADKAIAGDSLIANAKIEAAAGYGMTVANSVYVGVDAQVANFGIVYVSSDVEGSKSTTAVTWAPNLQARVGLPLQVAMPYIAGGFGYNKQVSVTGVDTLPEGNLTWSVRLGSEFKVTENMFVGVYGQFVKAFNEEKGEGAAKTTTGNSETAVGFDMGWTF
jgi:opacity protein-like surface antigen